MLRAGTRPCLARTAAHATHTPPVPLAAVPPLQTWSGVNTTLEEAD